MDLKATHESYQENVVTVGGKPEVAHVEDGRSTTMLEGTEELMAMEQQMPLTPYVVFLSVTAALAGFLFGYDTGVISVALPNIDDDLGHVLNHVESEWVTASLSVGALVGALGGGTAADRWGRKLVLIVGDAWFLVGAVIVCASYSVPQMIVGRIFLGFGVGIASAIAPVFIGEISPARFRPVLLSINGVAIPFGQFVAYLFGMAFDFPQGWRGMFGIAILPALVQGVLVHLCPESPPYELLQSRDDIARKTLASIYRSEETSRFMDLKLAALRESVEIGQRFRQQHNTLSQIVYVACHGNLLRAASVAIIVAIFAQLSGQNTLMYYSATIFSYVGFDNPARTGLIISGANLFFTSCSLILLTRVGKRTVLLCGYPVMIIGLALAATAFGMMTKDTDGQLVPGYPYESQWVSLMLGMMVVFLGGYAVGLGNIPWQGSELLPLELRGYGGALVSAGTWVANIIISATFLSIMAGIGAAGAFAVYAGIGVVGFFFILFCYPETSGLSLEEVQDIFHHGFGVRRSRQIRKGHKVAKKKAAAGARPRDLDDANSAVAKDPPSD